MTAKDVIEKYCNTCQYKDRCWNPCYVVIEALYDIIPEDPNQYSLFKEEKL